MKVKFGIWRENFFLFMLLYFLFEKYENIENFLLNFYISLPPLQSV